MMVSSDLHIPVVDLSNSDEELVARAVVKATKEWGVFQVVNHGIPVDLIRRLQIAGKQFFELPAAEKEAVVKPDGFMEGFSRRFQEDVEKGQGTVDKLFHNIWPPSSVNYRYWPTNPPDYREVNEEYARQVKKLCEKILEWLSEGLGLRREVLKEIIGSVYMMNSNYYPPCPHSDFMKGLPQHTDTNALTLIVSNEVPGLQVFKDDHWIYVEYIPSAVIVNIGDLIMMLSNGRYKNVLHKSTVDKERIRISLTVLVKPNYDMVVGPLPELTSDEDPPKFIPISYRDYLKQELPHLSTIQNV